MSTLMPEQLKTQWQHLDRGAEQAIDWIASTRNHSERLDREADSLIHKLRQSRNKAQRLAEATQKPMTVGFFGLSQAGKSYLISSLAADESGALHTQMGEKTLDFVKHINPPGNGKEATGLVTRFTRQTTANPSSEYPVEVWLFDEIEIAKILGNAFLHDFDQERIEDTLDEPRLHTTLTALSARRQSTPVAGVSAEDMVSLWDYMTQHAANRQKRLAVTYWPAAVELAPYLSIEDRAQLFAPLWGYLPELTQAYQRLARTLARLGHTSRAYLPLTALVREADGMLVQNDSIMNVDMLERLDTPQDTQIQVCPSTGQALGTPVSVSQAELTALTSELVIPVRNVPRETLFEQVDLLDFPGYRGRLGVAAMSDIQRATQREQGNPLAQLLLRGKVAYLFERYTERQEMNVLVVCTAANKQSDVKEVGGVLDAWIKATQGEHADIRGRRPSGLVWALTMFDLRIANSLPLDAPMLRQSWGHNGLIKMAMLERFGQYEWMQAWSPNTPFDTTFLVRKPRMPLPFIRMENGRENAFSAEYTDALSLMKTTFIEDEAVQRHVAQPAQAWESMLALDEGGMPRLAQYLARVATPEHKLSRINEQLHVLQEELAVQRLGAWYQAAGDQALSQKQEVARQLIPTLWANAHRHGELLEALLPESDALAALYMQEQRVPASSESAPEIPAAGFGTAIDFFSDAPATAAPVRTEAPSHEALFVDQALSLWYDHLRNLPEQQTLLQHLGVPAPILSTLVDELITASRRLKLDTCLKQRLSGTEQVGIRRENMVERQRVRVMTVLGDFVAWLGFLARPESQRPESKVNPGQRIFTAPARHAPTWDTGERLHALSDTPFNYTEQRVADWLIALRSVIEENAGHAEGRDISPDQNKQLGQILALIRPSQPE